MNSKESEGKPAEYEIRMKPVSFSFSQKEVDLMQCQGAHRQQMMIEEIEMVARLSQSFIGDDGNMYQCTPRFIAGCVERHRALFRESLPSSPDFPVSK